MNEENKSPDSSTGRDHNPAEPQPEAAESADKPHQETPAEPGSAGTETPAPQPPPAGTDVSAPQPPPVEPPQGTPTGTPPAGMPAPPNATPSGPSAPPASGPYLPSGPQPGQVPAGMPPAPPPGQPPHGDPGTAGMPVPPNAPPRSKRGPLIGGLIAGAVVLALLSGGVGGVVGYGLSSGGASSSPSETLDGSTVSDVAAAVQPSVVSISAGSAEGSGVVYDDKGNIITNNHVAEAAEGGEVEVAFADGGTSKAEVVANDPAGDLAVIKAKDADNLQPIEFGDSDGLKVGDTTLAIGSPLGLQGSVTSGIVSALDRSVEAGGGEGGGGSSATLNGLVQTDAAINPGNSGGALVNGKGELVGINTVIATAGGSEGSVGLGFAIPSATVKETVEQLVESGSVERAFLGVGMTDSTEGDGAIVSNVESGSPAEEAGIKRRDVITGIDDQKVKSASDVVSTVQGAKPGTKLSIDYERDGKEENAKVELGSSD